MGIRKVTRTDGHWLRGETIKSDQKFETYVLTNPEIDTRGGNFIWKLLTGVSQSFKLRDVDKEQDILDINTNVDFVRLFPEYKAIGFDTRSIAKSADYTAEDGDFVLVTTGASTITITLPPAVDSQEAVIEIKKVDAGAGAVTVKGNGSENIDGTNTKSLPAQYDFIKVHCDGTQWHVK
jgi:hypothetical protein